MEAVCKCGARQYVSEDAARAVEHSALDKCMVCRTFAKDHACRCDEQSDFRCSDCDTRHGSHGGNPAWV